MDNEPTNRITIIGAVTKIQSHPFSSLDGSQVTPRAMFNCTVKRSEKKCDLLDCQAWDKTAISILDNVKEGEVLKLTGSYLCDRYKDKNGMWQRKDYVKVYQYEYVRPNVEVQEEQQQGTWKPQPTFDDGLPF